jgi:hypothetical protein
MGKFTLDFIEALTNRVAGNDEKKKRVASTINDFIGGVDRTVNQPKKMLGNTVLDLSIRPVAQQTARAQHAIYSKQGDDAHRGSDTAYIPQNSIEKFIMGNEPVKAWGGKGNTQKKGMSDFLQSSLGVDSKYADDIAYPLVIAGAGLDFLPGGGKKKGAQKALGAADDMVDIIKVIKKRFPDVTDDVAEQLARKYAPKADEVVETAGKLPQPTKGAKSIEPEIGNTVKTKPGILGDGEYKVVKKNGDTYTIVGLSEKGNLKKTAFDVSKDDIDVTIGAKVDEVAGTDPEKILAEAIRKAKPVAQETEELRKVEKGTRAGRAEDILDSNLSGKELERAFKGSFKGEYAKRPDFNPIIDEIGEDTAQTLKETRILKNEALQQFEKLNALNAFDKVMDGHNPNESELYILEKAFGEAFNELPAAKEIDKKLKKFVSVVNFGKAFTTSFDMSSFRQGVFALSGHPTRIPGFLADNFKGWGLGKGEQNLQAAADSWKKLENYNLVRKYVDITGFGGKTEEAFYGANLAEQVPLAGKLVRASERAYSLSLTNLRVRLADRTFADMKKAGLDPIRDAKYFEAVGDTFNSGTGRGKFGEPFARIIGASGKKGMNEAQTKRLASNIEKLANTGLFSSKLIAARMSHFNPKNYRPSKVGKFAAKEKWQELLGFVGFTAGLIATVKIIKETTDADIDVETDVRSSDFGKVKINGTTRLDFTGGEAAYARVLGQFISGSKKDSESGEIEKLGVGYKPQTRPGVVGNFLRGKTSPALGSALNLAYGNNVVGEPSYLGKEFTGFFSPLYAKDIGDLFIKEGFSPDLIPLLMAGFFGAGVQTYGSDEEQASREDAKDKQEDYQEASWRDEPLGKASYNAFGDMWFTEDMIDKLKGRSSKPAGGYGSINEFLGK